MAQINPDFKLAESGESESGGELNKSDINDKSTIQELNNELKIFVKLNRQVPRLLSKAEESIVRSIGNSLRNWHEPWKEAFLADNREFRTVYDLMEGLLHYEEQIINSDSILSNERTSAIAQAVARLVDYGNAILNIDLIIRANDDASTELELVNVTTIELFQAHIKAHNWREKLIYDYFKKEKPNGIDGGGGGGDCLDGSATNGLFLSNLGSLQVPLLPNQVMSIQNSPTLPRSHLSSLGSSTSINTVSDGRRTPQLGSPLLPILPLEVTKPSQPSEIELNHMTATIKSSAFLSSRSNAMRAALLPQILSKIEGLMSNTTSADKLAACFELLDCLLDSLEKLPIESRNQEVTIVSTALLEPIVHKVFIDDRANLVEFQHAHWTTCLISILRLMTTADFNNYLRHFSNMADMSAFLKDYLFIVKRLLSPRDQLSAIVVAQSSSNKKTNATRQNSNSTYPEYWIEMTLLACSTFLTSLTFLYQFLRQYFASNMQMWLSFIECLIHFILHDALKPNRFMLKDSQRLLADDLRQTSAEYVWISWDYLNPDQKQQLMSDLIEPLLLASMTLQSKQRSILLPIFYDMVRCDYTSQYITPRSSACSSGASTTIRSGRQTADFSNDFLFDDDLESLPPIRSQPDTSNAASKTYESLPYLTINAREVRSEDGTVLTKFTHLIVGKLNNLMIDLNLGDERFKIELCAAISGQLNPKYYNRTSFSGSTDTSQFKCMAKQTSDLIAEFMQICLDSRQANRSAYKHLYLLCLFKLIMFFRDKVDRVELYLNNLYRLCQLHHTAGRYVEAGYTLLELAKTLPWSDAPLENHHRNITRYFQTPLPLTDFSSLKIFLYTTIVEYFDQGQLWEAAVPLCRELMDHYQFKTYEYNKLAQILENMSTYFSKITDIGSRSSPEYFRVTFYGVGFPRCLRNVTMVYRGKAYEKLADFQATMLSKYPDARLLNSLQKPDDCITNEPDARYLQINACLPVVDLKSKFKLPDISKLDQSILSYYKHNECDKFNFSRRISGPPGLQLPASAADMDSFANMWRERTTLSTNTLPGMLPFFQVYLIETNIVTPIESAIEDLERTKDRLSCMVNRFKADKRQAEDIRLLGQLLLGVVDAAVNGGITKYEEAFFTDTNDSVSGATSRGTTNESQSSFESNFEGLYVATPASYVDQQTRSSTSSSSYGGPDVGSANADKVNKLKGLIAQQVPLLDEAIRIHRDRVADVMRPQHEHLEASYKKLKHHVMSKYYRYLPSDYSRSTIRSFRSLARSPNRSIRSDSRVQLSMSSSGAHLISKQQSSDAGLSKQQHSLLLQAPSHHHHQRMESPESISPRATSPSRGGSRSSIPYRQLSSERRSLPFLTGVPVVDRDVIRDHVNSDRRSHLGRSGGPEAGSIERMRPPPPQPPPPSSSAISLRVAPTETITAAAATGQLLLDVDQSSIGWMGSSQAIAKPLETPPVAAKRTAPSSSRQAYTRLFSENRADNDGPEAAESDTNDGEEEQLHGTMNESRKSSDGSDTRLVSL